MSWHVPVSLGAVLLVVTVGDGTDDNATNSPEHLQHLSGRSSESEGYNLTAVGGCVGDEDSSEKNNREEIKKSAIDCWTAIRYKRKRSRIAKL